MERKEDYILFQYEELKKLDKKENVWLVRNSITGKIAVKKFMKVEQRPIYEFLKVHRSEYIPEIYEYFEDGQQLIVIEEYIEGRNLGDIQSERKFSEEEGCQLIKEICHALYPLHKAEPQIACRDLKPENIMLTSQNKVKLVDFDIARVVSPGKSRDTVLMGTEGFAAPEQFGLRQTDARSDIYGLGSTLNCLITGHLPVDGIANGRLGDVVRRCTALNPDERYQDVKELEKAIEEICPFESNAAYGQEKECAPKKKSWRRFLPPGFRSGTIWKMILALIVYLAVINLSMTMEIESLSQTAEKAQKILFLLSQLLEIGFVFNYMGWRDTIPFLKRLNRYIRILFYVALEFALIVISIILCVLMDGVFW